MPGPRAVPVRMTIKRERKLRQIIAAGTSPQRLVLRARIILAAAGGEPNAKIARYLGCSENTVREWRKRLAGRGITGIFGRPRAGRPEIHGPSVRLVIVSTATSAPPDGESCWSRHSIARHLRERGLEISRAGAVGRLHLDPPPGTVLVSVDEENRHPAQVEEAPGHPRPARPGRSPRMGAPAPRQRLGRLHPSPRHA